MRIEKQTSDDSLISLFLGNSLNRQQRARFWVPNELEKKCLRHLDEPENWRILKLSRPHESEAQSWRPFWRIFVINIVQYTLILTLVFFGLEMGSTGSLSTVKEDLFVGLGGATVLATILAIYVTHLYRRSWNRRATKMNFVEEDL